MSHLIMRIARAMNRVTKDRGIVGVPLWLRYHLYEIWRGVREPGDTGVEGNERNAGDFCRYQPMPYTFIDEVFRALRIRDGRSAILDYGCGKGRVVIEAARYACTCVRGIDLDDRLVAVAKDNIARAQPAFRCHDVSVSCGDARTFPVDPRINAIIMYNPFTGDIMRETLDRVRESYRQHCRAITICYVSSPAESCLATLMPDLRRISGPCALGVGSGIFLRVYGMGVPV
jgi:SAM-dependent methyltransferase